MGSSYLCGIIGNLGSGKTLFMVRRAWQAYLRMQRDKKYHVKIFSNIKLYPPLKAYPLDLEEMINQEVQDALILLDEGYMYMPSKRSQSDSNIDLVNSIMQIRKRNIDVFWTFQDVRDTERMIREKASHYVMCEKFNWGFRYTILKRRYVIGIGGIMDSGLMPIKVIQVPMDHAMKLFPLYDTMQIISISDVKTQRSQYKEKQKEDHGGA
jgi:hypothetical protein